MGATQSQSKQLQQPTTSPSSLPIFRHAITLNGLPSSGKSAVQSSLKLSDTRVLEVDSRFLTTPQIFTTNHYQRRTGTRDTNQPGFGVGQMDASVWAYGGRGTRYAKWQTISGATKAIVFTIDATKRETLVAPQNHEYLPDKFVARYNAKTKEEQNAIYATLKQQMYAKDTFDNLIDQDGTWSHKPVLVLLTHAEQPDAMTPEEVCAALELPSLLKLRDWRIASCNPTTGEGMAESINWLNYVISAPTDFTAALQAEYAEQSKKNAAKAAEAVAALKMKAEVKQEVNDTLVKEEEDQNMTSTTQDTTTPQNTTMPSVELIEQIQPNGNIIYENEAEEGQVPPPPPMGFEGVFKMEKREGSISDGSSVESSTKSSVVSDEEVSQQQQEEGVPASSSSSSSSYTSIQSTFLVLPPPVLIPIIKMELRKGKHFWSKKKMKPVEDQLEDIHQRGEMNPWGLI